MAGRSAAAAVPMVVVVPRELGLDSYLQGGGGVGRDEVAPDEKLRGDGVETVGPVCFGC